MEQSSRRSVASGMPEDNEWDDTEDRVQLVYQSWVNAGRPSASDILKKNSLGPLPSPPAQHAQESTSALPHSFIPPNAPVSLQVGPSSKLSLDSGPLSSTIPQRHPSPASIGHSRQSVPTLTKSPPRHADHDGRPDLMDVDGDEDEDDDGDVEEAGLRELDQKIAEVEDAIAKLQGMMANESKQSADMMRRLIKVKESELAGAQNKRAALSKAPKVHRHHPFVGERRARGMKVIQAARRLIHDFAVEENVDPTVMQRLLHATLVTSAKTSAWDAFQTLQSVKRNGGGATVSNLSLPYS